MKNCSAISLVISTMSLLLMSCHNQKEKVASGLTSQVNISDSIHIYNYVSALKDSMIRGITISYANSQPNNKYKVYAMVFQQQNFDAAFKIYPIPYYSYIIEKLPSGFMEVDDKAVLVYTGLEAYVKPDSVFIKSLKKAVKRKVPNDLLADEKTIDPEFKYYPYDPVAWKISLVNDSVVIDKNTAPPSRHHYKIITKPLPK